MNCASITSDAFKTSKIAWSKILRFNSISEFIIAYEVG